MPIRPEHRWLYPIDWPELSKAIRFGRAKGRCEGCGRPHGRQVQHRGDGTWWDEDARLWRDGGGKALKKLPAPISGDAAAVFTRVVLATAHLDHDPTNNHPRNLKALCQRCHILHDREEHGRRRGMTHKMRKALGDLFLGPYRAQ